MIRKLIIRKARELAQSCWESWDDQKALELLSSPMARILDNLNLTTCWEDQHVNRMPSAKIKEPINVAEQSDQQNSRIRKFHLV